MLVKHAHRATARRWTMSLIERLWHGPNCKLIYTCGFASEVLGSILSLFTFAIIAVT